MAFSNGKGEKEIMVMLMLPKEQWSKAMGQTASLLAKAAPSFPHHSSIGSLGLPMTIFLELWISLTNYEHIGPREISNAPIIPALTPMPVIISIFTHATYFM